jgi:sec-independent protein translocase protein TatA
MMNLQAPELMIVLAVVLLLFGSAKLPQLARSLGQSKRAFQDGVEDAAPRREPSGVDRGATPYS